jgi:predicted dehydrogenase
MPIRNSRRRFLQQSAVAAGTVIWPVPALIGAIGQDELLRIAVIGVAHRGRANLMGVKHQRIVALCDVDEAQLGAAGREFARAKTFLDFRKMLEQVEREIDAVVVSTPDHTHALPSVMAMRMGKHCYCEKPLTHSVYEARLVAETARQTKVATQIGTQIHAGDNYRRVVELVQAGAIGPIAEVHVWSAASYGRQSGRPQETPPVPPGLHWDLWLGPAPQRPYHPDYLPGRWRAWWDFGNGALGDFGCHYMDLPFWALGLRYPTRVEVLDGPLPQAETTPAWLVVRYTFPGQNGRPALKLTWYHGGKQPAMLPEILPSAKAVAASVKARQPGPPVPWKSGVLFVGTKGLIVADYSRHLLLPEKQFADFRPPPRTIPDSVGHHEEWIRACKSGEPTTCRFDYSGPLTEVALLGNVAYRAQSPLEWDARSLKPTNDPAAEAYLRRDYRPGWTL